MKNASAKESKALVEARAWKRKVSDLINDKGWDAFMVRSEATAQRWEKKALARPKAART
ncbi:MAG TPA: hypothetical protein VK914_12245 [bacterium]|jgi:hypothetical protein|nr:hypothetical protein [bacterium]